METKAEKREKIKRNQRKMVVRNRGIFNILRAKLKRVDKTQS